MSDHGESYKKYKSARALASPKFHGSSFRTDICYFLTTSIDTDDVVAILDTNALVGPVSGRAIWRFEVQAQPWGKKWLNGYGMVSNGRKLPRTPKVQVKMSRNMVGLVESLSESNTKNAPVAPASFLIYSVF